MKCKAAIFALLALFLSVRPAAAADAPLISPDAAPRLKQYLSTPDHIQAAQSAALAAVAKFEACADAKAASAGPPRAVPIMGPLAVDSSGALTSGAISEPFVVTGCNKQRVENILTFVDKGQVKVTPIMPGTTHADPVLAHDSLHYAYLGAAKEIGDCKDVQVIDTKFDDFEGGPNPSAKFQDSQGRPWRETWTLNACGKTVDSVLHYRPSEQGTVVSATEH